MTVVLLALAVGLAATLLTGGRLSRVRGLELHGWWLLLAAVAAEALATGGIVDQRIGYVVTALCAAALLLVNRALRGLELVTLGLCLNGAAVVANGGRMPVSLTALGRLNTGNAALLRDPVHVAATSHTALMPLIDRIAVPMPGGLGEVLSVGDVLLAAGVGLLAFAACRRPPAGGRPAG